ncbi:MAG: GreA/GreB family elongation factor [Nitrospinota bacterium]
MIFNKTLEKLEEEFNDLKYQLNVVIPKDLRNAAEWGDLKENAEYAAAKDRKYLTESRLAQISERIRILRSIDINEIPKEGVGLGSIVTLEDTDNGRKVTYELTLSDNVDVDAGKISIQAPIGRALISKKVNDEVTVVLPAGKKEYLIVKLTTIHQREF